MHTVQCVCWSPDCLQLVIASLLNPTGSEAPEVWVLCIVRIDGQAFQAEQAEAVTVNMLNAS